jgi:predicted PurR-regulated permease PerM
MTRFLLLCGALAGPVFVGTFLLEGARRPDYDPLRHPVSSLALGDAGWTQTTNFLLAGVLTVAFTIGVRRVLRERGHNTWGSLLIAIWGVGLIGAGAFVTDPISGYPRGTPDIPTHTTTAGALHDIFALFGFTALATACFVFTRWFRRRSRPAWAVYSAVTGAAFAVFFLLALAGLTQTEPLASVAGLMQRTAVTLGWIWISALAVFLLRGTEHEPGDEAPKGAVQPV